MSEDKKEPLILKELLAICRKRERYNHEKFIGKFNEYPPHLRILIVEQYCEALGTLLKEIYNIFQEDLANNPDDDVNTMLDILEFMRTFQTSLNSLQQFFADINDRVANRAQEIQEEANLPDNFKNLN